MAVALIRQNVSKMASHFLEILGKCFVSTKQGMTIGPVLACVGRTHGIYCVF